MKSSEQRIRYGNVAGATHHVLGINIAERDANPAAHARLQARSTRHQEHRVCGSLNLIRGQGPDLGARRGAEYCLHIITGEFGYPIPHPGCLDGWDGDPIR